MSQLETNLHEIIDQAKDGKIVLPCENSYDPNSHFTFYTNFATKINGKVNSSNPTIPIVNIPNYKKFLEDLNHFINQAKKVYANEQEYFELNDKYFEQKLILSLFSSPTNIDTLNFNEYIQKQIKMLEKNIQTGTISLGRFENYQLNAQINSCLSTIESTHSFTPFITDGEVSFYLPRVCFSVLDDIVYIYGVQNKNAKKIKKISNQETEKEPLNYIEKKFDRYFRKLNKGLSEDDELINVSPNALASLTIFCSTLKQQGLNKIISPDYMPIKYIAARNKNIYNDNKTAQEKVENLNLLEKEQFNMTNKFMTLLQRYVHHFDKSQIAYDDIKQEMQILLNKNQLEHDNIIYNLDNAVSLKQPFIKQTDKPLEK